MDIDKIVTDLVEKRIQDVSKQILGKLVKKCEYDERPWLYHSIYNRMDKIVDEEIDKRQEDFRKLVIDAIDKNWDQMDIKLHVYIDNKKE